MPRADQYDKHLENAAARAAAFNETRADYFRMVAGDICVVRFLEQGNELAYAIMHKIPTPNSEWGRDVLCLDQNEDGTPCPFCQSEFKGIRGRSTKGFLNLIWRGGPVLKKDENGRPEKGPNNQYIVVGYADAVWLWKCTKTVFTQIKGVDTGFRGLMSRDFRIRRQGSGMKDTIYFIEPAEVDGGPQPMMVADMALAQNKYNLDAFITPGTYEEAQGILSGQINPPGPQPTFQRGPDPAENVFSGGPPARSSAFSRGS